MRLFCPWGETTSTRTQDEPKLLVSNTKAIPFIGDVQTITAKDISLKGQTSAGISNGNIIP